MQACVTLQQRLRALRLVHLYTAGGHKEALAAFPQPAAGVDRFRFWSLFPVPWRTLAARAQTRACALQLLRLAQVALPAWSRLLVLLPAVRYRCSRASRCCNRAQAMPALAALLPASAQRLVGTIATRTPLSLDSSSSYSDDKVPLAPHAVAGDDADADGWERRRSGSGDGAVSPLARTFGRGGTGNGWTRGLIGLALFVLGLTLSELRATALRGKSTPLEGDVREGLWTAYGNDKSSVVGTKEAFPEELPVCERTLLIDWVRACFCSVREGGELMHFAAGSPPSRTASAQE